MALEILLGIGATLWRKPVHTGSGRPSAWAAPKDVDGTPFHSFLVPGLLLFTFVGVALCWRPLSRPGEERLAPRRPRGRRYPDGLDHRWDGDLRRPHQPVLAFYLVLGTPASARIGRSRRCLTTHRPVALQPAAVT